MTDYIKQLESKVKDCKNTNTIFDTRKYVLLKDAKEVLNQALNIPVVVGQSEQLNAFVDWWHNLSQEELAWYEGRYVEVFLSL